MSFSEYARRTLPEITMPLPERPPVGVLEGHFHEGEALWWHPGYLDRPVPCTFLHYDEYIDGDEEVNQYAVVRYDNEFEEEDSVSSNALYRQSEGRHHVVR